MTLFLLLWAMVATAACPLLFREGVQYEMRRTTRRLANQLRARRPYLRGDWPVVKASPLTHDCGGLWGKWERRTVKIFDPATRAYLGSVAKDEYQERTCDQCGFTQRCKVGA